MPARVSGVALRVGLVASALCVCAPIAAADGIDVSIWFTRVFSKASGLHALGIVLGAIGAVGVTRLLEGLLFGVESTDVGTFVLVSAVMASAAVLASLLPAIRATRVDPVKVLKAE